MAIENDLDEFARVIDGKIVEYPVYRLHIKNRAHPLDWYTPVVQNPKPELPPFSSYKSNLSVVGGTVVVSYTVVPQGLAEILHNLTTVNEANERVAPSIADVPPATVEKVYDLVGDYVMGKLSQWAATRKYTSFNSLTDYRDSAIPKFKAEALRAIELRDQIWTILIGYFTQVTSGELPVPTSLSEIDALMPVLLWPDETTPGESTVPVQEAPVVPPPVTTAVVHAPSILYPPTQSEAPLQFTALTTAFASDDETDSFSQLNWQLALVPEFTMGLVEGVSTNAQSFEVKDLQPGMTYYLRAAHVGAILGQSDWSVMITVTTPAPV